MYNEHVLQSGAKLRVVGNNLFVRPDPLPKSTAGGIIIPGDAVEHVFNTGTVLAVGHVLSQAPYQTKIPGIEKGDRVLFVRYLAKQDTNIHMSARLGEEVIRIRPADVVLLLDEEDLPRVRADLG